MSICVIEKNLENLQIRLFDLEKKLQESNRKVRDINKEIDQMQFKDSELDRIEEIEKRAVRLIPSWQDMADEISLLIGIVKKYPSDYQITVGGKKTRTDLVMTMLQSRFKSITKEINAVMRLDDSGEELEKENKQ